MNKQEIKALIKEAKATLKAYQEAFDKKYSYKKLMKANLYMGICFYASMHDYFQLEDFLDRNISGFMCATPKNVDAKTELWFQFVTGETKYITKFKEPYEALEPRINYLKKLITKYENKISAPTTVNSK
jgi:rhamnogalacturonyl hydrolase YesR